MTFYQIPDYNWKRVDETDINIKYSEGWGSSTYAPDYGGTHVGTTVLNSTLTFNFYGTKLRIISPKNTDWTTGVQITIDDVIYNYSLYSSTLKWGVLVFEKLNLALGYHTVEIKAVTTGVIGLDAIDIDTNGYLYTSIIKYNTMRINGVQSVYGGFNGMTYIESGDNNLTRLFIDTYGFDTDKLNTLDLNQLNVFPINIIKTYKE